jgi:hypothetical protein
VWHSYHALPRHHAGPIPTSAYPVPAPTDRSRLASSAVSTQRT